MKGKKWRDVRNSLVMVIVMVAMMSSATFAWFTLTSSPTVTGLQMVASSSGGLLVSNSNEGGFSTAITLADKNDNGDTDGESDPTELLKLTPVTPHVSGNIYGFSGPVYTGGTVTGVQDTPVYDVAALKGKVAVYEYYIKAEEGTVGVGIITGGETENQGKTGTQSNGTANAIGTFIRQKTTPIGNDTATQNAAYATRIGLFVTDKSKQNITGDDLKSLIIYEPNNNGAIADANNDSTVDENDTTEAPVNGVTADTTNFPVKVSSNCDGIITKDNSTGPSGAGTNSSGELFQVDTTVKKIYMFVWLEGTDDLCVNEIRSDEIEGQIQFTVVKEYTN